MSKVVFCLNWLIDVVRENLVGGVVMSSTEWKTITKHPGATRFDPKIIQKSHGQNSSVDQGYFLVYRAKAIRSDIDNKLIGRAEFAKPSNFFESSLGAN